MAKKKKIPTCDYSKELEALEKKKFYKMLLTPMPLEEKLDELGDLSNEDLTTLLEQFKVDEDYEICHAIKVIRDGRKADGITD
ncbi:hypothetical protein [uncultured Chitinophaga sp.]|uniref:hypothetical protein n=1 Tax=uncultured Chitinophaga sp. TaxID=339340 RepID=UPI002604DDB4|nr:hypothetical protein [uncultured Chitinophaga sp.]